MEVVLCFHIAKAVTENHPPIPIPNPFPKSHSPIYSVRRPVLRDECLEGSKKYPDLNGACVVPRRPTQYQRDSRQYEKAKSFASLDRRSLKHSFIPTKALLKVSAQLVKDKCLLGRLEVYMEIRSCQYGENDFFYCLLSQKLKTQPNHFLTEIHIDYCMGNNFVEHCILI